jgi:hypothetical protein
MKPRKLTSEEYEALRLLARSPDGCRQSIVMAHGLKVGTMEDLSRTGLAIAELRSMIVSRRATLVPWMKITDEGRRALGTEGTFR